MLNVTVIGAGYVGLVTGACLAELGHVVVVIDRDREKIAGLKAGIVPIFEPGLDALVSANVRRGQLSFETSLDQALQLASDAIFICVGTPTEENGGGASLAYVYAAAEEIGEALSRLPAVPDRFSVVVTKSTVPVGTSRKLVDILAAHAPSGRYAVASNPEFLREGNAIADFMAPDRIVIGSPSERARQVLEDIYLPLTRKGHRLVATSAIETSELIKYAANAFLATKVTFINELARLCEATGADIEELAVGVGLDDRIGTKFLTAGPGFGGSCFPKDLQALIKTANDFGSPVEVVETVIRANDRHKQLMVRKIRTALGGSLSGRRLGVLGLAFKANTDDMRNAPALTIVAQFLAEGAEVHAYDPAASGQARQLLPELKVADSIEAAVAGAEAVVILTEWDAFRQIAWQKLMKTMRRPLVVDLRNIFEPRDMAQLGIEYLPIGRQGGALSLEVAAE